jgi:hypothetical protein
MVLAGILVTLLGFALCLLSPGLASGMTGRLLIVLLGIALSCFGILGMINAAYLKTAIWKE